MTSLGKKQRRWIGYKTTDVYKTCPLCNHSNYLVRVGVMRWDWMRCPICLYKLDKWSNKKWQQHQSA